MKARKIYRFLYVHSEIDHVQYHLKHRSDDARSAGRSDDHKELAIAGENRGSHRRKRALARLNRVDFALHQPEYIRRTRFRREVVHLIVEQEARAGDRDAISEAVVERVGDGDGVAFRVDHVEVSSLAAFGASRFAGKDQRAGSGALQIDGGAA